MKEEGRMDKRKSKRIKNTLQTELKERCWLTILHVTCQIAMSLPLK